MRNFIILSDGAVRIKNVTSVAYFTWAGDWSRNDRVGWRVGTVSMGWRRCESEYKIKFVTTLISLLRLIERHACL